MASHRPGHLIWPGRDCQRAAVNRLDVSSLSGWSSHTLLTLHVGNRIPDLHFRPPTEDRMLTRGNRTYRKQPEQPSQPPAPPPFRWWRPLTRWWGILGAI